MDTLRRTRKNDYSIDATQNTSTHHTNEKKIQKDRLNKKDETNEDKNTNDLSSTGDESEAGQISNTHKDQDSDVSFETDTREEIDTTEIEEDCIDFIKRSTNDATEKMGGNLTGSSSQINKTWINTAKDRGRLALLVEKHTMTS